MSRPSFVITREMIDNPPPDFLALVHRKAMEEYDHRFWTELRDAYFYPGLKVLL